MPFVFYFVYPFTVAPLAEGPTASIVYEMKMSSGTFFAILLAFVENHLPPHVFSASISARPPGLAPHASCSPSCLATTQGIRLGCPH